jgi:hypothetical protein
MKGQKVSELPDTVLSSGSAVKETVIEKGENR